jgi:hypothetical protein
MAEPYAGANLGPLQQRSGASSEDWSDFPVASKAAKEDWSDFPKKGDLSVGETAFDVAKSGGVGLGKGTLALGGFVGDMTDLGAKGIKKASDFVSDYAGVPRYEPTQESVLQNIPTSASLRKNVEGVTGEFYKPQTVYGDYAEKMGEYAPAALLGPGGFVRKAGTQVIMPAVGDETAGRIAKDTPYEPYARAAGGVLGGVGGAVLSQPGQSVKTIRQQFAEAGITPQIVDNARKLMNSGVKLTWPEAISKAAGRPVLTDKLRVLESDPITSGRMAAFFADRPQQVDAAGMGAVSRIAPAPRDPFQTGPDIGKAAQGHIGDVRGAINKASEPYYQQAESVMLTPAEMSHVRAIPGWTEARDAVRKNPQIGWRVEHLPVNSVGFLNQVKKHFDQQAENAGSKFNPAKNREAQSSNEMAASALKQIGEAKSADYAQALDIQKVGRQKFLDPLLNGPMGRLAKKDVTTQKAIEALFPSNPLDNSQHIIFETVSDLARKNPGAAAQLVRAHIAGVFNEATQSLTGGPAQWGGAKFAAILTGNPQQRENLKAAITALHGKDAWRGFEGFLDAMEAIGTRQAKGSLTAFNPDQLKSLSGSNFIGSTARLGASPGKWWKFIDEFWGNLNKEKNMNTLADIFTDPKSVPLLKRIAAMPTGSREAGYVAARLIAQSENAGTQPREARRQ